MTDAQLRTLGVGDIIRRRSGDMIPAIVTQNLAGRATAVRTFDVTHAAEWELVMKADHADYNNELEKERAPLGRKKETRHVK